MSGHSKWSQIKHKKEVTDKKRSQIFSKLLRVISVAAKKDTNPQFNPSLRSAIDTAKSFNVPQENIERAIQKSSDEKNLEELVMEAYGPEGVAIIITALTDNRNRTISEIKKILSNNSCKWADPGSVLWAFTKEGNEWRPNFPQNISQGSKDSIEQLNNILEDHDDVINVFVSSD